MTDAPLTHAQILRQLAAEWEGTATAAGAMAEMHERGAASPLRPEDGARHRKSLENQIARQRQAEARAAALLAGARALEGQLQGETA